MSPTHRAHAAGIGRAHAKAILLGEHAVVYGAPALALPLPHLTVSARAEWARTPRRDPDEVAFTLDGPSAPAAARATESLRRLTGEVRAALGVADGPPLDVTVESAIPSGRGLGSSAAYARAVVLALADLVGREVGEREVFDLVQTAENVAHGRSSGIDAWTVGAPAPLLFQAGQVRQLSVGRGGALVIADSGDVGRTRDMVERVRLGFRRATGAREAFVRTATELTESARHALADGRLTDLGARLTDYHELLRAAGVSTDSVDALVRTALAHGCLGAKITGGGGGGCVIALTRPERTGDVVRRLHEAGATRTWVVSLEGRADDAL